MIPALLEKIKLNKLVQLDKSEKKKIIFIVVAIFLLGYLDFRFIIKPQFRYIGGISPKIVKLRADMDKLNKDLVAMKDLQNKQAGMKPEAAQKVKKIISQEQVPLLLQFISDVANKNNITVTQIKPTKQLKTKADKKQNVSLQFMSVSIALVLSCDYHRLGKFINDLENAENFFAVEEIRIIPGSSDYINQNVNLLLKTYVKK